MTFLVGLVGCGGGSSLKSSDTFSANLAPGIISYEGSANKDLLYASVSGANIDGGWIEDANGNKLPSSDLIRNDLTGVYEAEVYKNENSFIAQKYILKYVQNSDTLELKKPLIQWTGIQPFSPAPTLTWNPDSREVTVQYSPLSASNVDYYLRIYNSGSMLIRESPKTQGPEVSEYLPISDSYRVMLIGEIKNADEITETVRYFFNERNF